MSKADESILMMPNTGFQNHPVDFGINSENLLQCLRGEVLMFNVVYSRLKASL